MALLGVPRDASWNRQPLWHIDADASEQGCQLVAGLDAAVRLRLWAVDDGQHDVDALHLAYLLMDEARALAVSGVRFPVIKRLPTCTCRVRGRGAVCATVAALQPRRRVPDVTTLSSALPSTPASVAMPR